jgi:Fuc2NAc and GlcNAc transferase
MASVFLILLPFIQLSYNGPSALFLSLYGAGSTIALLGFLDDRGHIHAGKRLVVHFLAALWAVYFFLKVSNSLPYTIDSTTFFFLFGLIIFLVWLLNLYNFMDGIDAITGSETISVSFSAAYLYWLVFPQDPSWVILLLLASSVIGFQIWNIPPARLFMGDSGSAFLGIVLGILTIHSIHHSLSLFFALIILLGVYIVDTTITLVRRIASGEKFYQAHRTHAYQHAAARYQSHSRVSLGIALINLIWLFPIAYLVANESIVALYGICIGYTPLILTALYFDAGLQSKKL